MAEEKRDQQLDAMLDEMLAGYSAAEPRPGFEQRLATVLSESKSEPRWFETLGLQWAIASAAAVILIAGIYLFWPVTTRPPEQANKPQQQAPAIQATGKPSVPAISEAGGPAPKHQVVRSSRPVMAKMPVPKLETFPARAPLTNEERLLLSYMARTPRQELIEQSRPDEPLVPELDEGFPATPQNSNTQRNSR